MEKYLYFRTQAVDANDDAIGDSACWPVTSLMGMVPTGDSVLTLYFKNMLRGTGNLGYDAGEDTTATGLENYDYVNLNLTTANTHLVAMQKITGAINSPGLQGLMIIANDDSGGTQYLKDSGIASCGDIDIKPIMAWAAGVCCAEG